MTGSHTLGELAERLGGRIEGDPSTVVTGVAPLETAGPSDLSFLANRKYLDQARTTRAAAVLVGHGVELGGRTLLVVDDPYVGLAEVLEIYHHRPNREGGVSADANVPASCQLDEGVEIQPCAVLGESCRVGRGSCVMSGATLGEGVVIGSEVTIHPNVSIYDECVVGDRVTIHAGTVIGSDGFGFAPEGEERRKIPQVGNVVIGDDVEIGANVTIDRATFGSTVVGRGTKIDNLVQVAHNVTIGENSVLVAQVGISGSTKIGKRVVFAGQSGAVGHITIGDGVVVGAKTAVTKNLPSGSFVIGHPAIEASLWKRAVVVFARLPEIRKRLQRLEERLRSRSDGKEV